jgi:hypothetical protein
MADHFLHVQKYLQSHSLQSLTDAYGIRIKYNDDQTLVSLHYDVKESSKYMSNKVIQECRGIVLENKTWNLVALPFLKFFNSDENAGHTITHRIIAGQLPFNTTIKMDGTLIIMYFYKGLWRIATSGKPDASGGVGGIKRGDDWRIICHELVECAKILYDDLPDTMTYSMMTRCAFVAMGITYPTDCSEDWDQSTTYCFELTSSYNQVVVNYPAVPRLTFLAAFSNTDGTERVMISGPSGIAKTQTIPFTSFSQVTEYCSGRTVDCGDHQIVPPKQFEGVVIDCLIDGTINRIKIKTMWYLIQHQHNPLKCMTQGAALYTYLYDMWDDYSGKLTDEQVEVYTQTVGRFEAFKVQLYDARDKIQSSNSKDAVGKQIHFLTQCMSKNMGSAVKVALIHMFQNKNEVTSGKIELYDYLKAMDFKGLESFAKLIQ